MLPEQLLSQLNTAVLVLDKCLRIQYVNPAAESLLCQSSKRLEGLYLPHLFSHSTIDTNRLEDALKNRQSFTENDASIVFGESFKISAEYTATPIEFGNNISLLVELRRTDSQKKISQEVQQHLQQLAARDLVRGLAHEIKNPLGGLRGAAQLLQKQLPQEELAEFTQIIIEQADRLTNLVDRLLGPNRPPKNVRINVHELLEKSRQLLLLDNPNNISFDRDYDPSIPDLLLDPEQVQQAILNVSKNALQVLGEGGQITFVTRTVHQHTIHGKRYRVCAEIKIIDNGPGIPPEIKDTLFYPMVTAKKEGTGLGLSIAQTLINQHHGKIECDSWPGHTEFRIYFPIEEED